MVEGFKGRLPKNYFFSSLACKGGVSEENTRPPFWVEKKSLLEERAWEAKNPFEEKSPMSPLLGIGLTRIETSLS